MSFHKYKRKRVQIVSLICYEKWNIFGWVSNSLVLSRVIALATINGCAYDLVNLYEAGSIEHTHENVDKYKKKWEVWAPCLRYSYQPIRCFLNCLKNECGSAGKGGYLLLCKL